MANQNELELLNSLSETFVSLDPGSRYEYLEWLNLPAYLVQSVDLELEPNQAAQEVVNFLIDNDMPISPILDVILKQEKGS